MNTESIELPIVLQKEINSFTFVAFPVCIILTQANLIPWYYENFIGIFLTDENDLMYKDCDFDFGYYQTFETSRIRFSMIGECDDIVNMIIKQIELGFYSSIMMNEFFLPESPAYNIEHFLHDSLIYGVNRKEEYFQALRFDRNDVFNKVKYKFSDVKTAFRGILSLLPIHYTAITFFTPKRYEKEYHFSKRRFVQKIIEYLDSESFHHSQYVINPLRKQTHFGFNACVQFIMNIENEKRIDFLAYRSIHLLYEHKNGIFTRLNYISRKYVLSNCFETTKNEYELLKNSFNQLRLKALKIYVSYDKEGASEKLDERVYDFVSKAILLLNKEELLLKIIIGELNVRKC